MPETSQKQLLQGLAQPVSALAQHRKYAMFMTIGIKSQLRINMRAAAYVKHVAQHFLHLDLAHARSCCQTSTCRQQHVLPGLISLEPCMPSTSCAQAPEI